MLKHSPVLDNSSKCEIIMEDFNQLEQFQVFKDFIRMSKDDMTLLGVPILQGRALCTALRTKVEELESAINLLKLFQAHDALALLKSSISIPKLLYLLMISNCFNQPQILKLDAVLKDRLFTILNVDLDERQWIQSNTSGQKWRIRNEMC